MATYTVYLYKPEGPSITLEAVELGGGKSAPERALKLLGDHPGRAYVAVWEGAREVGAMMAL